jgi:hypothetical protein
MAASVIITPNSIVRMIVSATTDTTDDLRARVRRAAGALQI